jgi:hypothetical protein
MNTTSGLELVIVNPILLPEKIGVSFTVICGARTSRIPSIAKCENNKGTTRKTVWLTHGRRVCTRQQVVNMSKIKLTLATFARDENSSLRNRVCRCDWCDGSRKCLINRNRCGNGFKCGKIYLISTLVWLKDDDSPYDETHQMWRYLLNGRSSLNNTSTARNADHDVMHWNWVNVQWLIHQQRCQVSFNTMGMSGVVKSDLRKLLNSMMRKRIRHLSPTTEEAF